jgi:hypothetical protein
MRSGTLLPRHRRGIVALSILLMPCAGVAGPPFLTDDPEPTATGHWEIYAPLVEGAGKGSQYDGSVGAELNYGAAPNLQLTLGLPISYAHDRLGLHWGRADLELSAKYRFFRDERAGISVAAFPGLSVPNVGHGSGNRHVTALLPIWAQKDAGAWSIFGGGGYAINPGAGNRDYWTGGVAVANAVTKALLLGVEIDRQGSDVVDGRGSTDFGVGAILQLKAPFRVLASGGPTFVDGDGSPRYHAFLALGLDF